MITSDTHPSKLSNLRRSQRVCLSVAVLVMKPAPGGTILSEETYTLIVSAHGALLLLRMPLQAGQQITLKHKKTLEELVCRVVSFGGEQQSGKREIGVEFEHPAPRFWRIAFPPADWSPRGPDAKAHVAESVGAGRSASRPAGPSALPGRRP